MGFTIVLTTPACPLRGQMEREAQAAVMQIPGVEQVAVKFDANVRGDDRIAGRLQIPIKNIVAVASGKGGVGKSTVAVNLAVALAQQGAKVGILDADIYGPNIPTMMGLTADNLPDPVDGKLVPPVAYGVEVISMGFLIPPGQAVLWRGPMLHGAIRQLFTDVAWGELDYLIVDMPPGTGDATLTLAQSVPVTGGVIVSTPQDVALEDAEKGLVAFQKLQVPILGIVENMAGDIFGEGGGERAAQAAARALPGPRLPGPRHPRGGRRRPAAGGRGSQQPAEPGLPGPGPGRGRARQRDELPSGAGVEDHLGLARPSAVEQSAGLFGRNPADCATIDGRLTAPPARHASRTGKLPVLGLFYITARSRLTLRSLRAILAAIVRPSGWDRPPWVPGA